MSLMRLMRQVPADPPMRLMRQVRLVGGATALGMVAVSIVLLAACSSDGGTSPEPTTAPGSTPTTGTPASSGGSTSSSATTRGPAPAPGAIPFVTFPAAPADGVSPAGSGCTPGASTLPDGTWFGPLEEVDAAAGTIGLDLACLFSGDAANAAAAADGETDIPVPNDVYVRNQNPNVYTMHAVTDVAVGALASGGASTDFEPTQSGLAAAAPLVGRPVWIEVAGGWVIAIQQQFFP